MRFNGKSYSRNTAGAVLVENLETRRLMASINVADFGAIPNDGVDDSQAIQNAINASRDGDTILFAGGRFDVNREIVIKDNRTYTGGGSIKRPTGQGFIFKTSGNNQNVTITNLTFDGGGLDAGNTMAKNLKVTNSTFQNITKGWPTGNAILVTAGAENTLIDKNNFLNIMGETGIYGFTRFHNVIISNNYFEKVMEGVHFYYENGGDNLQVINNTFKNMKRMAIEIQGRGATNTLIANNVASEWSDRYHESFFLSIVNLADGVKILNNRATSGKWGEIDTQANNAPVGIEISGKNVLVEGNFIEGFREGMHLMNIRDAVVQNNTLRNQTWMGIWRTGVSHGENDGSNLTIQNNTIYNPKGTAFLFHGRSTGVIRNNTITLFGNASEYQEGSGGALNNVSRPGNNVTRTNGAPVALKPSDLPNNGGSNLGTYKPAPTSPTNMVVKGTAANTIVLNWNDNSDNETGFKVQRKNNKDGIWSDVVTLGANISTYTDSTLEAANDYSYRVLAFNDTGVSGWSNEHNASTFSATIPAPTPIPVPTNPAAPAVPSELQVQVMDANTAVLNWKNNANNAFGFRVEYSTDGGAFVPLVSLTADVTSWTTKRLEAGKNYQFRVRAYNSEAPSIHTYSKAVATPTGNPHGLKAVFFNDKDMKQTAFARVDPVVNFNWGYRTPAGLQSGDNFAARWTGQVEIDTTEEYTFYAGSDDGIRLWIDGQLVIDRWIDQPLGESRGSIKLEAGRRYDIRLEYYESTGQAQVYLAYSSNSVPKQFIPKHKLFSHTSEELAAARADRLQATINPLLKAAA